MQQTLQTATPSSTLLSDAESALVRVEQQIEVVGDAVRTGEPEKLEMASHQLRNAALALSHVLDASPSAMHLARPLAQRLDQAVRLIGLQREQLARRSALVERALSTVLPEAPMSANAVYAPAGASRGNVARIYDARS
ncbi:hypothetical protein ACO2Q9_11815 [Variovorax sp. VNK109]|uniref:hypothetical protein n=1 Tax=Variovorax sp. VNK109 TaxID=3400919 RepID=UPI003C0E19DF